MATSNNRKEEQTTQDVLHTLDILSSNIEESFSMVDINDIQPNTEETQDYQSYTSVKTTTTTTMSETETTDIFTQNRNASKLIYVGNYDFIKTLAGELSFRKGDRLEILDQIFYPNWWQVKNLQTNLIGYVPLSYLSPVIDLTGCEWYFSEVSRREAERYLKQPYNEKGTFLIRQSETSEDGYSLSVLDLNKDNAFNVKHYRIRRRDDQRCYYISGRSRFPTLQKLVHHYQTNIDGLCTLLTHPCQKIEPTFVANLIGLFELDRSLFLHIELVNRREYNKVYQDKYGQVDVAIRPMKMDNRQKFLHQAKRMSNVSHENIVRFYGVCTKEEPIFIVTELMPNGCLLNYLRYGPGKNIKFQTILHFAAQIAKGMTYLERRRYVHCNLAARNIFVGECDVVKIGDFGLAKILQDSQSMVEHSSSFRIEWTAPEVITKQKYTTKSDVWSFAILLYELITYGSNPYPEMTNNEVLDAVLNGYRMPKPDDCSERYYEIMCSCWKNNPYNRPKFKKLYKCFDEFVQQDEPIYWNKNVVWSF